MGTISSYILGQENVVRTTHILILIYAFAWRVILSIFPRAIRTLHLIFYFKVKLFLCFSTE